jgi:predicted dehydrogenase
MSTKKKVRVGLVGCGGMARGHARRLLEEKEVEVAAICDPVKNYTAAYQKEIFKPAGLEPKVFSEYGRMLSGTALDAVVLSTPHTLHYEEVVEALERGLHVLVEKPMVTDSGQARDVVERARGSGRVVAIAFQGPCSPEFAYVRNVLRRGGIGTLQVVDAFVAQDWMRKTVGKWRQDPKLSGGGQLYDSGAHMINGMLWFVERAPTEVYAAMDYRGTAVDINSVLTLRFGDGCLGSVACLGHAVGFAHQISLYGSEGVLRAGVHGGGLEHIDASGQPVKYPYVPYEPQSPVRNFVNAIQGRDEVRCGPEYGLMLSLLMDAAYESVRTGQPVQVKATAGAVVERSGGARGRSGKHSRRAK